MPFVMAVGIGISIRNAQAVIEAIIGKKSEFARTPKFKIEGKKDTFVAKKYRNKAGWIPYAEALLGIYFAAPVVYSITNETFATSPFLLLFVWGYLYTGCMSLGPTYFAHLSLPASVSRAGVPGPGVTASLSMLSSSLTAARIAAMASSRFPLCSASHALTSSLCTSICFDQYWLFFSASSRSSAKFFSASAARSNFQRSEERRVGKECRSRW